MANVLEEKAVAGQYRFTVATADEAVRVLRERLGENARVVSVRQVEGAGLARFLRAPKLEVIAELPSEPGPVEEPEFPAPFTPEGETAEASDLLEQALLTMAQREAPGASEQNPAADLARVLHRGCLPPVLLASMETLPEWSRASALPLGPALNEVALLLRGQYQRKPRLPLLQRVAFIGTAGAGKTTLCKWLAADVFVRQRRAAVLKVDLERANPSDGLAVFCDALAVPLARSPEDLPKLSPNESIYVDLPGISLGDAEEIALCRKKLTELEVESRVLVINAAYEAELIKRIYQTGEELDATHVVFTHLDELTHWGKLWEFVLGHALTPLFLSSGPSVAGDFIEEIFPAILARTFPVAGS